MRAFTAAILVVLTTVLCVIAYDLHTIARTFRTVNAFGQTGQTMTREQRREQMRREQKEIDEYWEDMLAAHETPKSRPDKAAKK